MNDPMVKRRGNLLDLEQIYALEKMVFKNEAWTIDMLKIELLCRNNSETLIIEENKLILGYFIYRRFLNEYYILNIGVSPHRQKEGNLMEKFKSFLSNLNEWGEIEEESEYQGRKVTLNKPTKGDVKKSKVYVKNEKGNVVKVEFGDPNMEIKADDPARRRSFRARHNCENPGPKWKARYWSCKAW